FSPRFISVQMEDCANAIDDDGNGLIDLADPSCSCQSEGPLPVIIAQENDCPTDIRLSTNVEEGLSLQWYFNDRAIPEATQSNLFLDRNALLNGQYRLRVVDSTQCWVSEPFTPTIPDRLRFTETYTGAGCEFGSQAGVRITMQDQQTEFLFFWLDESDNLIGQEPSIDGLAAGYYVLQIRDSDGCLGAFEFQIETENDLSVEILLGGLQCRDGQYLQELQIIGTGGAGPYEYGIYEVFTNQITPNHLLPTGSYTGYIMDALGCGVEWGPLDITTPPSIDLAVTANPQLISSGEPSTLNLSSNLANGQVQWWPTNDLNCDDCLSVLATPNLSTTYYATITDTVTGCAVTDSIRIEVILSQKIYVPTAFSPNNDGINDVFQLFPDPSVASLRGLKIFDRWGGLVYDSPETATWNGKANDGTDLANGTYLYAFEAAFIDGKVERYVGMVQLLR
ncbi:MAG: gliding motility-associated C-terminal domain-containing protein, partial [Bacteroidota bacterium]